nr:Scr1 family TA system antitoxin-like transcriptional regulator [Nocardiopsis valliformis]
MKPPVFREALRRQLQVQGMTQAKLSRISGISQSSLSRYLSGKSNPTRDAVNALDVALSADQELIASWREEITEDLPPFLRDAGNLERQARRIDLISPVAVPGLLWSVPYAEMVYRAGRKVKEEGIERLARMRSERLQALNAEIVAVFPITALTWAPERLRVEQAEHLLALPDRVAVHLLPEGSVLWGTPGPFGVYRLIDGREVVLSDRLEGNEAYGESTLPRARELVRDALSLALPPMVSTEKLRGLACA